METDTKRLADLPPEVVHIILLQLNRQDLFQTLLSKHLHKQSLRLVKHAFYKKLTNYTRLNLSEMQWSLVALVSLACLNSNEYDLQFRVFSLATIDEDWFYSHPNPLDPYWKTVITCTMDYRSYLGVSDKKLVAHEHFENPYPESAEFYDPSRENPGLETIVYERLPDNIAFSELIIRFSERMDLGSFLLYIPFLQPLVLRFKPVGVQTESWIPQQLICWDSDVYGYCFSCKRTLDKVQVCADCRVPQYCSRVCQKEGWTSHKEACKHLAFEHFQQESS